MKKKKKKNNKIKLIRAIISILFIIIIVVIYINISNKKAKDKVLDISADNISYYINIADNNTKNNMQLNWIEIAAIDSAKNNNSFQKDTDDNVNNIAKCFYTKDNKMRTLLQVTEELKLDTNIAQEAIHNYELLKNIKLRDKYIGKNESKDKFIDEIKDAAIENYKNYKILPSVTISQAILESDWGNSSLAKEYNNFYGIKADNSWDKEKVKLKTTENYNDNIYDYFRVYNNKSESIIDYGKFLSENSRYKENGVFDGGNYITVLKNIEKAGYATAKDEKGNPVYAKTLINIIRENNLMIFDYEIINEKVYNN